MSVKNNQGGCFPTSEQELLLQAALLKGEDAIAAWHQWKTNVDFDSIDAGSHRLLPLVYRNLSNHGVQSDPLLVKMKEIYKRTWFKNTLLFNQILPILHSLQAAGIDLLLLKGSALTIEYYKDYGLRPMADFDILIRLADVPKTINLLKQLGWSSEPIKLPQGLSVVHSLDFKDKSGKSIDLHWHVLAEGLTENADDDFWNNAILTKFKDLSIFTLNPTDNLLHVCVHGARWNPVPPIRWVSDAMIIINSCQDTINWEYLLIQAQKRRLVLPLKNTLNLLHDLLNAPVPLSILQRLETSCVSAVEKQEYHVMTRKKLPVFGSLIVRYLQYLRSIDSKKISFNILGFLKHLSAVWSVDNLGQFGLILIGKFIRRIGIDIFSSQPHRKAEKFAPKELGRQITDK